MRVRINQVINPHYTDLCIVIGPDVRWVENDVEDLLRYRPEVLLGYRVMMTTAALADIRLCGTHPEKVVILDFPYSDSQSRAIMNTVEPSLTRAYFPKVERWHVHRREGVWQVM